MVVQVFAKENMSIRCRLANKHDISYSMTKYKNNEKLLDALKRNPLF